MKILTILHCFLIILLAGCQGTQPLPTPPSGPEVVSTTTSSMTPVPTRRTATPSASATRVPSQTPTIISTPTSVSVSSLSIQCLDIAESLPAQTLMEGVLVLYQYEDYHGGYLLNVNTRSINTLPFEPGVLLTHFQVSPNGQWLAYLYGHSSSDEIWLVIATADGQPSQTIQWEIGWWQLLGWLDNENLLIERDLQEGWLDSLIVLNPFTGQQTELLPGYPNMDYVNNSRSWSPARMVPDPSLTRILYPRLHTPSGIVLWDALNSQILAVIPYGIARAPKPSWSPDGRRAVVAGDTHLGGIIDEMELYLVDSDGQVVRATYLTEYYAGVLIFSHTWSPDGSHIAFWMATGSNYDHQLALLDTTTFEVTNYCIPPHTDGDGVPPVWSPDSRWLAVDSQCGEDHHDCIVLVDVTQEYAARIVDDMLVAGWMVSP